MNLRFPELGGGTEQGLNDAGVENFQGAIDVYVSRECGQNTGDAIRHDVETARLVFERFDIPATEIPGFGQLREVLSSCLEHFGKLGGKPKEKEFFTQALATAGGREISVLKISDYGTTGLTGGDLDENGRWFALVKSQGVSNKGDTAGGSFGIGKSSPYAASRFRTVFYGTKTEAKDVALQGVCRLVTHKNQRGKKTQGVGFIGTYDATGGEGNEPVFRAVRDEASIPSRFRRTEPGTDIWVVGYRSGPEWSRDLTRSILTNFWPAIHRKLIEFQVGSQIINRANLPELIHRHIGQEEFEAHHFYRAIQAQPIKKKLRSVGDCELYLATGTPDLPKKICMVRKTGMRIYDYEPRSCRVPFSGLFICTDKEGNKLLRQMEPPKHDLWDAKRVESGDGKKALDEIKTWIRDEVKKLNPLFSGKNFNENELAKYVQDPEPEELPQDGAGTSDEESLDPKPVPQTANIKPVQAKPVTPPKPGAGELGRGDEGGAGGGEHEDGEGGGQSPRGGGGKASEKPPGIGVRSYRSGAGEYQLVLRSGIDFKGAIRVLAVGEDGYQESVELKNATLPDGTALGINGDAVNGVQLKAGQPTRIKVTIQELERRSLTAVPRI